MDLGPFSISLAVKDLAASRSFYETLGFSRLDGDGERWLMMSNGKARIGLFQQMFEQNLLTFNPNDARSIETTLKEAGYTIDKPSEGTEGPAHFSLRDPDGNMVLIDQHVAKPEPTPVGKVGWVDLTVDDAGALKDFYADVLRVETSEVDMGGYADFCLLDSTGAPSSGICYARGKNAGLPPVWLVYFVVRDLDACMVQVEANGGKVLRRPESPSSGQRFCVIQDPQGAHCALFQNGSEDRDSQRTDR